MALLTRPRWLCQSQVGDPIRLHQGGSYPSTLSSVFDRLLKKECDIFRELRLPHQAMTYHDIKCVPFVHKDIEKWRNALTGGIRYLHDPTNLIITGAIDDIWINKKNQLHIVDYKSSARDGEVSIDAPWQVSYKRQVELYQWLFRRNGFAVSNVAYFVYANADLTRPAFESKLEFETKIIDYEGDDGWVNDTINQLHKCLISTELPEPGRDCDYCAYFNRRSFHENTFRKSDIPSAGEKNSGLL